MTTPGFLGGASSLPDPLPSDPLPVVASWLEEAWERGEVPNPNAMVLATSTADGRPSARVVLCKEIDLTAREVVFYTNYESRKGRELAENPRAAGVFHWDHAQRQVRIEGAVRPCTPAESDAYFATRPVLSRLGAWASRQSQDLQSPEVLAERLTETMARLGITWEQVLGNDASAHVPRPAYWGGYRLGAERVELWCGGEGRLHERAVWERGKDGTMRARLLQP